MPRDQGSLLKIKVPVRIHDTRGEQKFIEKKETQKEGWINSQTDIFMPIFLGVVFCLGVIQVHPAEVLQCNLFIELLHCADL